MVWVLNFWHRLIRAVYLRFGKRHGEKALEALPFRCLVRGLPKDETEDGWVSQILAEVGKTEIAPIVFTFRPGQSSLENLPRASVLLVEHRLAEALLFALEGSSRAVIPTVVVEDSRRNQFPQSVREHPKITSAKSPTLGKGLTWLQQFS